MPAFGAVDLFSGSTSIGGSNLWQVDKNPLVQLDEGVEDVVGKQAGTAGTYIMGSIMASLDAMLGIKPSSPEQSAQSTTTYQDVITYLDDFLSMFGLVAPAGGSATNAPGSSGFDLGTALLNWIDSLLMPTNTVAPIVGDANSSGGVTGFVPLENLALDLIGEVVGGAQGLIDAILETVGFPPGSGTTTQVNQYFTDFLSMFSNPELTNSTFNAATATENYILNLIYPSGLLTATTTTAWLARNPGFHLPPAAWLNFYAKPNTAYASLPTAMDTGQLVTYSASTTAAQPSIVNGLLVAPRGSTAGPTSSFIHADAGVGEQINRIGVKFSFGSSGSTSAQSFTLGFCNGPRQGVGGSAPSVQPTALSGSGTLSATVHQAGTAAANFAGSGQLSAAVSGGARAAAGNFSGSGRLSARVAPVYREFQLVFTPTTWTMQTGDWSTGTGVYTNVASGSMILPLNQDLTEYTVECFVAPSLNTITVSFPNGQLVIRIDGAGTLANYVGEYGYLEMQMATDTTDHQPQVLEWWYDIGAQYPPNNATLFSTQGSGVAAAQVTSGVFGVPLIPGLDATKIISGQFAQSMVNITNIPASIVTGVLNALNIPGLDATKIVSGIFTTGQIPYLDASWITSGGFPQWLLPLLPVGSVGSATPNLLANPTYATAASIGGGAAPWTWDGAVTHTADGSGSVVVTANGSNLQLSSDPATPVSAGQILQCSHWLEWSGVSGAGVCFALNLVLYLGSSVVGTQTIATVSNPAASSGWVQLSGNYTILSGVDSVRVQLQVLPACTAGTIHWDDASLTKVGAFDASWITSGQLQQWILPLLPVSSVGQTTPNLLSNPTFAGSTSVAAGTAWSWDGSTTHTADGSGSVKTTANGSPLNLFSDPSTPVSQYQVMAAGVYVQWSGLTGTGPCIQLSLVSYLAGNVVSSQILQTISNPAASSTWFYLQGTYTVPSGVDAVRLEYQVLPGATAGTVWFDDASLIKTNNLLEAWTTGLPGDLNNLSTQTSANASNISANASSINAIQTNGLGTITDLQTLSDHITNALIGAVTYVGTTLTQALGSMQSIYNNMLNNTQQIQALQSQNAASSVSGSSITIDFANYPDGALSQAGFTVNYSGAGSSQVGIKGGLAGWSSIVNDGGIRTATIVYNVAPSMTDFQRIAGSMNSAPSGSTSAGQPYFYALGRVDNPANPQNYVWARAYCTGFLTYKCDLGCTVAGVQTVWTTGIPLTWSTSMAVLFGANGNPRRYQVFSGTNLVVDYTEVGTASQLGSGFRYWGAINTVTYDAYYNTPGTGGTLAGTAMADNAPPARVGSTFSSSRLSTTNISGAGGNQMAPNNFFDTNNWTTPDLVLNSDGSVTVTKEGSYVVKVQYNTLGSYYNQWFGPLLYQKPSGGAYALAKRGLCMYLTGEFTVESIVGDVFNVYCKPGDTLMPGFYTSSSGAVVTGTADGLATMWTISLANWSTA